MVREPRRAGLVLGALGALAAAALGGCYSPSLHDCTVTCSSAMDCASDQVCGADGLCASPGSAGHCHDSNSNGGPDAGPSGSPHDAGPSAPPHDAGPSGPPQDARPIDAPPPIDAAPTIALRVMVQGKGSIVVDGQGTCSSQGMEHGDCTFMITARAAQTVRALPIQIGQVFKSWTSPVCGGEPAVCTFTPTAATTVTAKFEHL
jgi:hypothetical protein